MKTFLENCTIPFLFPANVEVPNLLKILSEERIANVGYCQRTRDDTKIDFKFAFEYLNSSIPQATKKSKSKETLNSRREIEEYYVVAECKNWANSIGSKDLIVILEKMYNHEKGFLGLLFCNTLNGNFENEFHDFCAENFINVYKIVPLREGIQYSFRVEAVHECAIQDLPQFVCIVIETSIVNDVVIEWIKLQEYEAKEAQI